MTKEPNDVVMYCSLQ